MRDALLDIVQHTHNLGVLDLVKITGSDKETTISAMAEDRKSTRLNSSHIPLSRMPSSA